MDIISPFPERPIEEEIECIVAAQEWVPSGMQWEDHTPEQKHHQWFLPWMRLPSSEKVILTRCVVDGEKEWTVLTGPPRLLYETYRWRYSGVVGCYKLSSGNFVIVCRPTKLRKIWWSLPRGTYMMDATLDFYIYPLVGIHRKTLDVLIQQPLRDVWMEHKTQAIKPTHSPYIFLRTHDLAYIPELLDRISKRSHKFRLILKHWGNPMLHPTIVARFIDIPEPYIPNVLLPIACDETQ